MGNGTGGNLAVIYIVYDMPGAESSTVQFLTVFLLFVALPLFSGSMSLDSARRNVFIFRTQLSWGRPYKENGNSTLNCLCLQFHIGYRKLQYTMYHYSNKGLSYLKADENAIHRSIAACKHIFLPSVKYTKLTDSSPLSQRFSYEGET